ncbi:hypothetical protein TSOC_004828 [Tetrabaena socialis]|uniref:Right handed beta helix domain-containing protein n=1 Tax=Tetrabaena socialis TaxID=47790 RepID=A0A2J8A7T5_9CHLO|nr:hypothetical protein TSOC_004828 [Tetrabaena socialis]|eukprot:PNH08596.1 hypothetical protein TSOC_004828 [Tetrabaena socialis]
MDGQNLVVYGDFGAYTCRWFKDEEFEDFLQSVQESDREHVAELVMQRADRPAMLALIKSSSKKIQWFRYLHHSDSPKIRGNIVAAIGINDQTLKDYSGEIYLENLGDIDLTCKELPTDKSVIVVKEDAGTEGKPVTMKEVRFQLYKETSPRLPDSPTSFLLDVGSHVTLDNCELSDSTWGGAVVRAWGHLKATRTMFRRNKSFGVAVKYAGSTAVLEEDCKLSDNEGNGASVGDGGHLQATRTTFSGNTGNGVCIFSGGTVILKEDCTLSDNEKGARVEVGVGLEATGTTFSRNVKVGVNVSGTGSKAVLMGCKLFENVAGTLVGDGGRLEATGTTFSRNVKVGVCVSGTGSKAVLTGCTSVGGDGREADNGTIVAQ